MDNILVKGGKNMKTLQRIALVLTIFFPKVKTSFESVATNLDKWMTTSASTIFNIK